MEKKYFFPKTVEEGQTVEFTASLSQSDKKVTIEWYKYAY